MNMARSSRMERSGSLMTSQAHLNERSGRPQIAWVKLRALCDGAALASKSYGVELKLPVRDERGAFQAHAEAPGGSKKQLTYETERIAIDLERLQLSYSGMQAVTVISTSSSGKFNIASTVVRAGLLVGKNFAYSSL